MHKTASEESVASLHDLSAVDLIAGFRGRQFSPSEVLEDVLAHIARWEPHIKALYASVYNGRANVIVSIRMAHARQPRHRANAGSRAKPWGRSTACR